MFPHHECELAQNVASRGKGGVKYWMHNNMITINGQKMGKSLGNFITLPELFSGKHAKLDQAYSPMTVRFFILQAHYRSTLDFSNEALQAAEKGYKRLMQAWRALEGGSAPLLSPCGSQPISPPSSDTASTVRSDERREALAPFSAKERNKVVFPDPLGPASSRHSPGATVKAMSRTRMCSP